MVVLVEVGLVMSLLLGRAGLVEVVLFLMLACRVGMFGVGLSVYGWCWWNLFTMLVLVYTTMVMLELAAFSVYFDDDFALL